MVVDDILKFARAYIKMNLVYVIQQQDVLVLAKPNPVGALFTTMVVVAFTCKLLDVIYIVVNIVTVDAFFIDWEQVFCNSVNRMC